MDNNKKASKTIEDFEGVYLPVPKREESSFLVWRVRTLRKKSLADFTIEDLRIMIGQDTGLEMLIPIALEYLEKNPFVEGDFYPGDLLKMVLTSDKAYWKKHPELMETVIKIFLKSSKDLETMELPESIKKDIFQAFDEFCEN